MINLILKDLRLTKKIIVLGLIYAVFVVGMTKMISIEIGNIAYCFLIICMIYLSVLYADGYDETNKGFLMLASLPVKRSMLVWAKYLSLGLYFLIYSVFPTLLMAAVSAFSQGGFKTYSPWSMGVAFIIAGILYSIYYPIYYKFGYNALRVYKIIVFVFIILLPKLVEWSVKHSYLPIVLNMKTFIVFMIAAVFILLLCSCRISGFIYEKKELI